MFSLKLTRPFDRQIGYLVSQQQAGTSYIIYYVNSESVSFRRSGYTIILSRRIVFTIRSRSALVDLQYFKFLLTTYVSSA